MNQKEDFLELLIEETVDNKITWNVDPGVCLMDYVLNPNQIIQVFRSERKGNSLFYIIQKFPEYHSDLDEYFESTNHFINIISNGVLALSITSDEVAERYMDDLLSVIRNQAEESFLNSLMD